MTLKEALTTFSDQLPDIRKACVENIRAIEAQYSPYKELQVDDEFTPEAIHQHVNYLQVKEKTAEYVRTIKRIDARKKPVGKNTITEEHIARAKEVDIGDLYDGQLYGRVRRYGLCPFHNEKTPSFYIFKENRFKCFGCGAHGTAIDFLMLRDGKPFVDAVKFLCNL